jgi:hypothetical protein
MTVVGELARYELYDNNSKLIQPFSHIFWFTTFFKTLHVSAIIKCFNNTRVKGTQGFSSKVESIKINIKKKSKCQK